MPQKFDNESNHGNTRRLDDVKNYQFNVGNSIGARLRQQLDDFEKQNGAVGYCELVRWKTTLYACIIGLCYQVPIFSSG